MVTIAFAFIVQHGAIEWRDLTGGANGLMNEATGDCRSCFRRTRDGGASRHARRRSTFSTASPTVHGAGHGGGAGCRSRRTFDRAQPGNHQDRRVRAIGGFHRARRRDLCIVRVRRPISSVLPVDPVPSGCRPRRRGLGAGPVVGASASSARNCWRGAEYRLLFGSLLLVVLWLAPEGVLGTLARWFRRAMRTASGDNFDLTTFMQQSLERLPLDVSGVSIAFGGIKAATDVGFTAEPAHHQSHRSERAARRRCERHRRFLHAGQSSIRIGSQELAGLPAWKVARPVLRGPIRRPAVQTMAF